MKQKRIVVFLFIGVISFSSIYGQNKELYKLPSGPSGPGEFGAYYTHLKYDPEWDKDWRIADHPDIVVRFDDGGHKFVFWRGTSYIPCWVTDNDIWYTNEFVERRGIHCSNTEGCVEPMSDKQCRYSHVRIIESNDARVVVHWRYAPIDVHYEHSFVDQNTGWFDWVDEYYVIYPDATGVRAITVHSGGLNKWLEFQEGIVVNQPGTLPDDNIERGAVSVANMQGEHKTYYWDKDGAPAFNENPSKANILKINLKSERTPFALVAPPEKGDNLITSYRGHSKRSVFNWWDHWPVSQDASDGRGARSSGRPSHSSLCHISLQIDPPVDCWGSYGYETVIRDGILEWTSTEWSALNLILDEPKDMRDSILLSFDYANLWTPEVKLSFYDKKGASKEITLAEFESEFVLNKPELKHFKKKIYLPNYTGEADLAEITEFDFEISGTEDENTWSLDNVQIISAKNQPIYALDFNQPDGSLIEKINVTDKAEWEPYMQEKNSITKLMLHGMTGKKVQDLVPLAKSWVDAAKLEVKGNDFQNKGYDPMQMAYVIEQKSISAKSLVFNILASKDEPMVNPAFVIKNWDNPSFELSMNSKKLKNGEDYRYGIEKRIDGSDLVIWIKKIQDQTTRIEIDQISPQ